MDGGSICKACGADLPLPDLHGRASCLSCGRTNKVTHAPPTPPPAPITGGGPGTGGATSPTGTQSGPFTTWTPEPGQTSSVTVKRRGGCASFGCLTSIVLAVVGLASGLVAFRSFSDVRTSVENSLGLDASSLHPSGSLALPLAGLSGVAVDGGGLQPVEVATAVYDASGDTRHLARIRLGVEDDEAVLWLTDPLPANVYEAPLALSGDTLFAGVADKVWALSATTGEVTWKGSLPDVVRPGCTDCLVMHGDTLLVHTADAQLVAFGAASSEPKWSRRMESLSGRFVPSGAGIAVVDHPPGQPAEMQVFVLDPATGATVSNHLPTCDDGTGVREFNITDLVYAVPDSPDLVATVSFGGGCAVRWNGTTGQVVWSGPVGNGDSLDSEPGLVAGDRLFLASSSGLISVDIGTGQWSAWTAPPDTAVRPLVRHGAVLVAASDVTRGTGRSGLVAWDVASGQIRWQTTFPGDGELLEVGSGSTDALFSGSPRSVVVSAGDHLAVATFDGEARTISAETIDPAAGTRGSPVITEFGGGSGTPSVRVHVALPTALLVSLDNRIMVVGAAGQLSGWPS